MELIKSRYSVRQYDEKLIGKENIDLLLEAGRVAPTAANRQPCRYFVLQGAEETAILEGACNYFKAPLVMVICTDMKKVWNRKYDDYTTADTDASIITAHIMLQAQDMGLGSCWIAHFDPKKVREALKLPENIVPVNILAMGYPSSKPKSADRFDRDRKNIEELVYFGPYKD